MALIRRWVVDADQESSAITGSDVAHTARNMLVPSETEGSRIGRYKLLQQIGEGGCGVVYMAEQDEPVRRRVALKLVKLAKRHGGGQQRLDVDDLELPSPGADDELLVVNDALDRLSAQHPVLGQLVKLRYFVGMTVHEAAEVLGISADTAKDHSAYARAWLFREINKLRGSDSARTD